MAFVVATSTVIKLIIAALVTLLLAFVSSATPIRRLERDCHLFSKENKVLSSKNQSFVGPSSCENVTCKLEFNADDVDLLLNEIFEDEALAVFLYMTIRNKTIVSDLSNHAETHESVAVKIVPNSLQLTEKWAWLSKNRKAKFLATLPYDVDILSLNTLTKDVYNRKVGISSTPMDCYLNLTEQCLKYLIAERLTAFTKDNGQVCYKVEAPIDSKGYAYKCCHLHMGEVHCDIPVQANLWIQYSLRLLWFFSFAFGILSPLLLKYLPKEFYRRLKGKNRQMRRSDSYASSDSTDSVIISSSKNLISKGDGFLDIARSSTQSSAYSRFNRCLFVMLLSFPPLVQILLYVFIKKSEVGVSSDVLGLGSAFLTLLNPSGKYASLGFYIFCVILLAIAMSIPKTLSELARRLSGKKDEQSFLGFQKPDDLVCHSDERGFQLMYEKMIFHLNCLLTLSFWKFAWSVLSYPLRTLCHCNTEPDFEILDEDQEEPHGEPPGLCGQIFHGLVLLITFPIWVVIITSAFILYLLPVTYVAFRIWKMLFKLEVECSCCQGIPTTIKMLSLPILYILFIAFCICVEASYFLLVLEISVNIVFLGSVVGFTTMGVLLYFDTYISYVVVIILGVYYMVRALNELKVGFKRVKVIIFEECREHDNEVKTEASIRDTFAGQTAMDRSTSVSSLQKLSKSMAFVVSCDEKNIPSIPLQLFLAAQDKVFPFKRVIISKIWSLLMIYIYIGLVFSFVMSLVEYKATDSFVQAIAILFLGAIPYMIQGNPNEIPEKEHKWIKFHVKEQITKYCKRFS